MKTVKASQAKQKFGELLDMAQRGPVTVTSHGRPVAVIVSAANYEAEEARKLARLRQRLDRAKAELAASEGVPIEDIWPDLFEDRTAAE